MRILLGVTGGVAAYKALEVARQLIKLGHLVQVVATQNSLRFVGATSFEALTGNRLYSDLFADANEVPHVELAKTDLILVVPATASFIAKYAHGIADDLLLNVLLASKAPVIIAPAMHTEMWQHPATQANLETLSQRLVNIIEPGVGALTSGDFGKGRLAEVAEILAAVSALSEPRESSQSRKTRQSVVITAGGTREPIDAVRFIGNESSGRQGVAIARALVDQGFDVTLIGANIPDPKIESVYFIAVKSHTDLKAALANLNPDYLVMAAAVSDFSMPKSDEKLSRDEGLVLALEPTEDLVANFAKSKPQTRVIAFAAETLTDQPLRRAALEKLKRKGVVAVVANPTSAIGSETNQGFVVTEDGWREFAGTKSETAEQIIEALRDLNVIVRN